MSGPNDSSVAGRKDSIFAQVPGDRRPTEVVMMDDDNMKGMAEKFGGNDAELQDMLDGARDATAMEHSMGMWEAVKLYPKAVGWSVLASTALVMEVRYHIGRDFELESSSYIQGYDLVVIGSFYGLDAFQRKYGVPLNNGTGNYSITAAWQSGLSNGANVGEIIGNHSSKHQCLETAS